MAKINLRPWREELRAERQKQFLTMMVGILILACGLVFLWIQQVDSQIGYQKSRNNYLASSMKELDKKIKEIENLRTRRKQLLDRMKVIQNLQGTRPVIVRVFDELVRTLPSGLYYQTLERKGDLFTIHGVAESNNRISSLMRNLELSEWFADPNLTDVSALTSASRGAGAEAGGKNQFDMTVKLVTPEEAPLKGGKK